MLANSDPDMQDTVVTVCQLTMEQKIRQQCEAREDYYRRTVGREQRLREALAEKDQAVSEKEQAVSKYEKLQQKLNELGIDIDIENDI